MFLIFWILGAFIVAFVFGVARTIGFWASLLLSIVLSPVVGLLITLFFETKAKAADRRKMLELQEQNNLLLRQLKDK